MSLLPNRLLQKPLSLGIDAGGTYTDAVVTDAACRVLYSEKALTTYPDPIGGIRAVLDLLDDAVLEQVGRVCVSTTFATNAILEQNGDPVALIMIGDHRAPDARVSEWINVSGGHDHSGKEAAALDVSAIRDYVARTKDRVSAYAVSAVFGVFNPSHEIAAKKIISEMTGYPVVCGHELSQALGAHERSLTAYLNASLLPVAKKFTDAVSSEIERRNPGARIMMLKCGGTSAFLNEVTERPVETIFSGPAASVLGASALSGHETCLAVDIGGTSTDVSMVTNGFPDISDTGASVAGWRTKVQALKIETIAMGGDSHVFVRGVDPAELVNAPDGDPDACDVAGLAAAGLLSCTKDDVAIGPRRVMPLCRASSLYPAFLGLLRSRWVPHNQKLTDLIQPTLFYMKADDAEQIVLTDIEKTYLSRIAAEPTLVSENTWEETYVPSDVLQSLVRKRAVSLIGFTPTDALCVLGDCTEWDREASLAGAVLLANLIGMNKYDFCRFIKDKIIVGMASEAVYFLDGSLSREQIRAFLENNDKIRFSIDVPVVLIGASAAAYADDLRKKIHADISVPAHADVGNAVGTLFGKLSRRVEVNINISVSETASGYAEKDVFVYTEDGPHHFRTSGEAVDFARSYSRRKIAAHMERNGFSEDAVLFSEKRDDDKPDPERPPVRIRLITDGIVKNPAA